MNANKFQLKIETVLQSILKRDDIVSIMQVLSTADPDVRQEVSRQFKENKMLRQSFEIATLIFDELIIE